MTQPEATYWNGQRCPARRTVVIIPEWRDGDPPGAWWRSLAGQRRDAVLVDYAGARYLIDDDGGHGWAKVTEGRGSPRRSHRDLPTRSFEVTDPADDDIGEDLDTFMFGVLMRQWFEEHGENRVDYHAALDWVIDGWRHADDPRRKEMTLSARAMAQALESVEEAT